MIHWRAPEFIYHKKDISWYWLVVIIAVVVFAISLWQKNFLFAVFTVIAAGTLLAWGMREPRQLMFELTEEGLHIGKEFYQRDTFSHFHLIKNQGEWDKLILQTKSKISPYFVLPVPREKFDSIKKYCLNFWTETEIEESFIDQLGDFFRF